MTIKIGDIVAGGVEFKDCGTESRIQSIKIGTSKLISAEAGVDYFENLVKLGMVAPIEGHVGFMCEPYFVKLMRYSEIEFHKDHRPDNGQRLLVAHRDGTDHMDFIFVKQYSQSGQGKFAVAVYGYSTDLESPDEAKHLALYKFHDTAKQIGKINDLKCFAWIKDQSDDIGVPVPFVFESVCPAMINIQGSFLTQHDSRFNIAVREALDHLKGSPVDRNYLKEEHGGVFARWSDHIVLSLSHCIDLKQAEFNAELHRLDFTVVPLQICVLSDDEHAGEAQLLLKMLAPAVASGFTEQLRRGGYLWEQRPEEKKPSRWTRFISWIAA